MRLHQVAGERERGPVLEVRCQVVEGVEDGLTGVVERVDNVVGFCPPALDVMSSELALDMDDLHVMLLEVVDLMDVRFLLVEFPGEPPPPTLTTGMGLGFGSELCVQVREDEDEEVRFVRGALELDNVHDAVP